MSEIKIETITSVHVGSGNFLQYNTDFFKGNIGQDNFLFVTDERKILAQIGEENLDNWVLSIEKGENTKDFVQRCNPKAKMSDYSKRALQLFGAIKPNDTLKEHIHDGMGRAYIPGSSIKGAIRSAVLATCINNIDDLESKIAKGRNVSAKQIEESLFGSMQSDVFRFLQVGDAFFKKDSEIAIRLTMALNITQSKDLDSKYDRKPQVVEAIRPEEKSSFRINIDDRVKLPQHNAPLCLTNISNLFAAINKHTKKLIIRDLDFWEDISDNYNGADNYIDSIKYILEEINYCKENECILRLGHGSGWDFITGGWARNLDNFDEVVVPASRPGNYKYEEYPFPKSRRLDTDSEMLGFVKLSF